jgi:protein-S-isoprenylcysteine O-methyltransferase Ste14
MPFPRTSARSKRIGGTFCIAFGFLMGFVAMFVFELPPTMAAVITTLDAMVGFTFYYVGWRQYRRETRIERERTNG